jgi:hypothetical protein
MDKQHNTHLLLFITFPSNCNLSPSKTAISTTNMTVIAERLFSHLHTYKVIICKSCKYAVWPSEVDSHLSGAHHRIAKQQRKTIVQR